MDGWERWRVVCLAALSVEDIEDIYLFGTIITGLLLVGLGIGLVYQEMKKTATAVKSPIRLPVMVEAVCRTAGTVGTQTVAIDRKMDYILEKLKAMDTIMEILIASQKDLAKIRAQFGHSLDNPIYFRPT